MGFKFLAFYDVDPEDWDTFIAQMKEMQEYMEKTGRPGAKQLIAPHMLMGDLPDLSKKIKFVGIVEYDDPDALVKSRAYILPDKPAFIGRFVRIDAMSDIIEEYEKKK